MNVVQIHNQPRAVVENSRGLTHILPFCDVSHQVGRVEGISIALTMGSSIAFAIHSVDRSFDPIRSLDPVPTGMASNLG